MIWSGGDVPTRKGGSASSPLAQPDVTEGSKVHRRTSQTDPTT